MTKNTKSTSTKTVAKTDVKKVEAPKTKVRKASPTKEAYNILTTELKRLSTEKKTRKSELLKKIDAMWAEYKKYTSETYKPARKAAIDKFNAVKAERKTARTAVKPVKKTSAKKVATKVEAKPEMKVETPVAK